MNVTRRPVPVRTILAAIGLVLATLLALLLIKKLERVLGLLVVSMFLAAVVTPAVDFLARHRFRRSLATLVVFLVGIGLIAAMLVVFIQPIVKEVNNFTNALPRYVEDAKQGRGTIGHLVKRYNIDEFIAKNQGKLQNGLRNAGKPALEIVRTIASTVFALVTILVLTFLMVLEGPRITKSGLELLPEQTQNRVRRVAADCGKAVTGYMAGNLAISLIAGLATFGVLEILRLPFAGVLGLWVGFADLIPLVGATLGAIPTVLVAFIGSPVKGFIVIGFYAAYQQFENHVLQTTVMSRTVDLNPLAVLVSVLVGVELYGFVGALLAIPVAGMIQVVVRDIYNERTGRFKAEPTVGADEIPIDALPVGDP